MNNWYKKLKKAPWTPPSKVFGIVWSILYTLLFISFFLVWNDKKCFPYCNALTFFLIQLVLNLSWTTIFFKFKKPILALVSIILIILFTLITFRLFIKVNKIAAYLLVPYIAWLLLAGSLNLYIVLYN